MIPNIKKVLLLSLTLLLVAAPVQLASGDSPAAPVPAWPAGGIPADPLVQQMLDQVKATDVAAMNGNLSGVNTVMIEGVPTRISTRYTPAYLASQYAYEQLSALGLQTTYFDFFTSDREVVAEQPGTLGAQCIYLLGAHLDSTSQDSNPKVLAPGADDNASGAAGVLIAASILSKSSFQCTIRYALFTAEEQGLYGSDVYARHVRQQNEALMGILNLDMIGYDSDSSGDLDLVVRSNQNNDWPIASAFQNVIRVYQLPLRAEVHQDNIPDSDHYSFWMSGFPAVLAIESSQDFNPDYHSQEDTLDKLNIPYFTSFVRAAVGTMAHLAGPGDRLPLYIQSQVFLPLLHSFP
jgi:hypothetical protein